MAAVGLRRAWEEFLRSPEDETSRLAKLRHLDHFLSLFLANTRDHHKEVPFFSDLRSVANLLAREFLIDVHDICRQAQEEDVERLQCYLSTGRGAVLLTVLYTIGVEGLSCSQELADLLVSLLPLYYKIPSPGATSDKFKDDGPSVPVVNWSELLEVPKLPPNTKFPPLTEVSRAPQSAVQHRQTYTKWSGHERQHQGSQSEESSDCDGDELESPFARKLQQGGGLAGQGVAAGGGQQWVFSDILQRDCWQEPSSPDAQDRDEDVADDLIIDLAPVQLCIQVLEVVRQLAHVSWHHSTLTRCIAPSLVVPLVEFLEQIHQEAVEGIPEEDRAGWSEQEMWALQRQVAVTTVTVMAYSCLQPGGLGNLITSGAASSLLSVARACCQQAAEAPQPFKLDWTCNTLWQLRLALETSSGIWLLLQSVFCRIPPNPSMLKTAVNFLEDVMTGGGLSLLHEVVLLCEVYVKGLSDVVECQKDRGGEDLSNTAECVSGSDKDLLHWVKSQVIYLLDCVTKVIRSVKRAKVNYIHNMKCSRRKHRHCDYSHFEHHHHDVMGVMGSVFPEGVLTMSDGYGSTERLGSELSSVTQYECLMATLSNFLLQLMGSCSWSTVRTRVLACVADGGLCCCVSPAKVVSQMLVSLDTVSPSMCNYTLCVLTRCLLHYCGGSEATQSFPNFCAVCKDIDATASLDGMTDIGQGVNSRGSLTETSDSALSESETSLQSDSTEAISRWRCVRQLLPYLCSEKEAVSLLVCEHMLRIVGQGSPALNQELFSCLILPVLQATVERWNPCTEESIERSVTEAVNSNLHLSDSVIEYCLSTLPVLLSSKVCRNMFFMSEGVKLLGQLVQASALRHVALQVYEKLVLMEAKDGGSAVGWKPDVHLDKPKETRTLSSTGAPRADISTDLENTNLTVTEAFVQVIINSKHANHQIPEKEEELTAFCDLWTACSRVFPTNPGFRQYFARLGGAQYAKDLLLACLGLVCSRAAISGSSEDILNSWLNLAEATLIVCLEACCFTEVSNQEKNLVEQLWSELQGKVLPGDVIQAMCDMLLTVSLQSWSWHQPRNPNVISVQHLKVADAEEDELTDWSDLCDSCSTYASQQGYEADSEISQEEILIGSNIECRSWLKWPELCNLAVRLLSAHDTDPAATHAHCHVLLKLGTLAKDNPNIARSLYSQGMVMLLLRGFHTALTSSQEEHKVERQLILDLLLLLLHREFSALELGQFLALFKENSSSLEELLETTVSLVQGYEYQPSHILTFPLRENIPEANPIGSPSPSSLHTPSRGKRASQTGDESEYLQLLQSSSVQEALELDAADSSPSGPGQHNQYADAGVAAMVSALKLGLKGACRPVGKQAVSVSLWLRLEGTVPYNMPKHSVSLHDGPLEDSGVGNQLPRRLRVALKQTVSVCSWSPACLHVLSLGDPQLQLQLWVDVRTSALLFRLINGNGGRDMLAEGGWRHLLVGSVWHHLAFSYQQNESAESSRAKVTLMVDGCFHKTLTLDLRPRPTVSAPGSRDEESQLYLGQMTHTVGSQARGASCSLSNVMVFEDLDLSRHQCFHLFCLGPECPSLAKCDSLSPTTDYALHISLDTLRHSGLDVQVLSGSQPPQLDVMSKMLVVAYSPGIPAAFLMYGRAAGSVPTATGLRTVLSQQQLASSGSSPLNRQPRIVLIPSSPGVNVPEHHGLYKAVSEIGGIGVFLFLFAHVVEQSHEELVQAQALHLLFTYLRRRPSHTRDFANANGYSMLVRVLMSNKCTVGYHILKVLLDGAVSGRLVYWDRSGACYKVAPNHNCIVRDVCVVTDLLLAWRVWERTPTQVWELGFEALESLVREGHPHRDYNIRLLQAADLPRKFLLIFLERIQEARPSLAVCLCQRVVGVMRAMLCAPLDIHVVMHVWDMLLLLHPAASTFINHAMDTYFFHLKWTGSGAAKKSGRSQLDRLSDGSLKVSISSSLSQSTSSIDQSAAIPDPCIRDAKSAEDLSNSGKPGNLSFTKRNDGNNLQESASELAHSITQSQDFLAEKIQLDSSDFGRDFLLVQSRPTSTSEVQAAEAKLPSEDSSVFSDNMDKKHSTDLGAANYPPSSSWTSLSAAAVETSQTGTTSFPEYESSPSEKEGASNIPKPLNSSEHDTGGTTGSEVFASDSIVNMPTVAGADPGKESASPLFYLGETSGTSTVRPAERLEDGASSSSTDVKQDQFTAEAALSSGFEVVHLWSDTDIPSLRIEEQMLLKEGGVSSPSQSQTISDEDPGLVALCSGLLGLLCEVVEAAAEADTFRLLGSVMRPHNLLIMAHHGAAPVRTAVVSLLAAYWWRAMPEMRQKFLDLRGFHLLACQLHQHATQLPLVEACTALLLGQPHSLEPSGLPAVVVSALCGEPQSVVCLLSLVERSLADLPTATTLLTLLYQLFWQARGLSKVMVEAGLVSVLANMIFSLADLEAGHGVCNSGDLSGSTVLLWDKLDGFFSLIFVTTFSQSGMVFQQSLEDCLMTLHSLEQGLARQHGPKCAAVENVNRIKCHMFQAVLDHVATQNEAPAASRRSLTSKVGEVLARIQGLSRAESAPSPNSPSQTPWSRKLSLPTTVGLSTFHRNSSGPTFESGSPSLIETSSLASLESHSGASAGHLPQLTNLTQKELLERFKRVLTEAVDNVLFAEHPLVKREQSHMSGTDAGSPNSEVVDTSRMELACFLLDYLVKALLMATERGIFQRRSSSSTLMWQAKDTIRLQFSRLFPALLAPDQALSQRLFALDLLSNHPKCTDLLKLTLHISGAGQRLVIYLHDLLRENLALLTTSHQDEADELHMILQNNGFVPIKLGTKMTTQMKETLHEDKITWQREHLKERSIWRRRLEGNKTKFLNKLHTQAKSLAAKAMEVTQMVVNTQNRHRRNFVEHVKSLLSAGLQVKKNWQQLIQQLTHERAVWHCPKSYPQSWQLDSTEGPCRIRRRLQRCHLSVEPRFLDEKFRQKLEAEKLDPPLAFLFEEEADTSDSAALIYRLHTNEKIEYTSRCSSVTPSTETPGELLLGEASTYFVADEALRDSSYTQALLGNKDLLYMTLPHDEIKELHRRWFQLQDNALEVFLSNGKTFLLAFPNTKDRDQVFDRLQQRPLPGLVPGENLSAVMQLWQDGRITNFEYLTHLNKMAGRSFNDLMQYPIFPFVLAQYQSDNLDLEDPKTYRNLSKPIAVQDKSRESRYIDNYKWLEGERLRGQGSSDLHEAEYQPEPYHYGSHYSNSGTVLHFLVRLPPFTQMFLHYQDHNFDLPDRTFHCMYTAWRLASFESTTDVKELIPEFFFLPEFLSNTEGFDFGIRQDGRMVWDVRLPAWCKGNPRLFTLVHRQALESDYVTQFLPSWIDLVFGFKQTGRAAVEAVNVFHPATYFGIDVASIRDPVRRTAIETMIKTYGQTPKLLFKFPHPGHVSSGRRANISKERTSGANIQFEPRQKPVALVGVSGLRWGWFLGSPDQPEPMVAWQQSHGSCVAQLVALPTGQVFGLAPKACLLVMYSKERGVTAVNTTDVEWAAIVSWGHRDNILRIRNRKHAPAINFLLWNPGENINCCAAVPDCRRLFLAGSSGVISHYSTCFNPNKASDLQILGSRQCLYGHAGAVTTMVVSKPFSVLVTGSEDHSLIIWDLNRLSYVRSITSHKDAVKVVAISDTLGDIASVSNTASDSSHLLIHTINGQQVASYTSDVTILCLVYSTAPEGCTINVLAGGLQTGVIRLWSSWNLEPVRDITAGSVSRPIISLSFNYDNTRLYAASADGLVTMWARSSSSRPKHSNFIPFL